MIDHAIRFFADDAAVRRIGEGFLACTLAKTEWTHEAHLLACLELVHRFGPGEALAILRAAIPPYNEATGVANTPTGGYHDTITVYYVWAIDRLLGAGKNVAEVLADHLSERTALLDWWDRDILMSSAARTAWVPPTVAGDGPRPPS